MSELNEMFQRREREIALSSVGSPEIAGRVGVAVRRKRRARQVAVATGSALVTVAVVVSGVAFWPSTAEDPVAPTVSSSASPVVTPSSEPSPTSEATSSPEPVSELIEGFAPVPQLPADQIPWDEVGPGWFLVDYHLPTAWDHGGEGETMTMHLTGEAAGGLSLLSPDGQWYAARSFQGTGAGLSVGWDGKNAWLATEVADGIDSNVVSGALVDLRSGADGGRFSEVPYRHLVGIDPGRALAFSYQGDGIESVVAGPAAGESFGCSDMDASIHGGVHDDWSFEYLPNDWGGLMMCFLPRPDGRTDVLVLEVSSPGGSMTVSTFQSASSRYAFLGWIDGTSFVFGKMREDGGGTFEQLFTYDLETDEISPIDVPAFRDHGEAYTYGYFDRQSQRFVVPTKSNGAWSVDIATLDGTAVVTLSGECPLWADFMASGDRLVVSCEPTKQVWLYSLTDGAPLGEWTVGGEGSLSFYDYPEQ